MQRRQDRRYRRQYALRDPTEIEFEAAGGSRLLDLRTDAGAWSLTQSDNTAWCTPALTSGKTSTSFAVTATANESSKRSATLTFTAPGCDPVVVTVTQSGDASQDFEGEQVVAQPDAWDNRKRADISYQLLVYSFADGNGDKVGDLPGLTRRLDYIDALGASAVWLSPIHPAASYHGYDVLDYEAVNPAFGTDADLRAFIDAARARGIRVYLDYVLNHTGKDHPWFKSAAASEGSPYRDRYIFSEDPQADIAAGRIDQIATEGAAGYDAGQWFSTTRGGCRGTLQVRTRLDKRRQPDGDRYRNNRRRGRGQHAGRRGRQIPLFRQRHEQTLLRQGRQQLRTDARLRLRLGIPRPHLDHVVGRRHQIRRPGQLDDHPVRGTLHPDVEPLGRPGQRTVLAADDVPFALLDGGIRRPQLR